MNIFLIFFLGLALAVPHGMYGLNPTTNTINHMNLKHSIMHPEDANTHQRRDLAPMDTNGPPHHGGGHHGGGPPHHGGGHHGGGPPHHGGGHHRPPHHGGGHHGPPHSIFSTTAHPSVFSNTTNTTTGGHAIIRNSCAYPLYLWSVGASISPQYTLPAYHSYRESFRHDAVSGGVALKITTAPNGLFTGRPQTIFAYNLNVNASSVWYDLSDVFGDPFEGSEVKVGVMQKGGKTSVEEGLRWADGVPPRGSQVRVVGAREDLRVEFC
ncbi:Bys1 family protein [Aspergillus glaucus CBS 516.65]|uniref:Bys1 family protein n=1 Tax=Aspergillus glaucus CBS 516.65 TaxID=1160497 RepID=A0A1L9VPT1_ASPGL|nr:hypothetical protein ASPGLDRAFT_44873 [Aspergillus glaucus CBS 516.65]OJJ85901.1 hypothetical protein ASPGLDRAFT_44873 [Aspergillus glaucus CBS 516.65]